MRLTPKPWWKSTERLLAMADGRTIAIAVFVYYRVARADGAGLLKAFGQLPAVPGFAKPKLMRRVANPSSSETWMEVWKRLTAPEGTACVETDRIASSVADRIASSVADLSEWRRRIDAAATAAGLIALVEGERHYEFFESCA